MRTPASLRSAAIKILTVIFVTIIAIDTAPLALIPDSEPFAFLYTAKSVIRPALRPVGLWQAEWRLFAPDPIISNNWWTIEVTGELAGELQVESGQISAQNWNTPFWGAVGPFEKFYKRRHIAFFRRLSEFPPSVASDYVDYWVRQRFGNRLQPLETAGDQPAPLNDTASDQPCLLEVTLYRNELKLAFPDDGTLPTRDETVWMSVTEKYLQRKYGP